MSSSRIASHNGSATGAPSHSLPLPVVDLPQQCPVLPVWSFWHSNAPNGADTSPPGLPASSVPADLRMFVSSWERNIATPTLVKILTLSNLHDYVDEPDLPVFFHELVSATPKFIPSLKPLTQASDCVRFAVLKKHGGLWLDLTTLVGKNHGQKLAELWKQLHEGPCREEEEATPKKSESHDGHPVPMLQRAIPYRLRSISFPVSQTSHVIDGSYALMNKAGDFYMTQLHALHRAMLSCEKCLALLESFADSDHSDFGESENGLRALPFFREVREVLEEEETVLQHLRSEDATLENNKSVFRRATRTQPSRMERGPYLMIYYLMEYIFLLDERGFSPEVVGASSSQQRRGDGGDHGGPPHGGGHGGPDGERGNCSTVLLSSSSQLKFNWGVCLRPLDDEREQQQKQQQRTRPTLAQTTKNLSLTLTTFGLEDVYKRGSNSLLDQQLEERNPGTYGIKWIKAGLLYAKLQSLEFGYFEEKARRTLCLMDEESGGLEALLEGEPPDELAQPALDLLAEMDSRLGDSRLDRTLLLDFLSFAWKSGVLQS